MAEPTLLIVDGHALIHRAFHALPPLTNSEGLPTGAVFGFTKLLLGAMKQTKPTYVTVAFDSRGPTFRHKMFEEYKGHRERPDDLLIQQIPLVQEVVRTLSIPIFQVPGFEADDLIGTVTRQAAEAKVNSLILTGDMDMLQLVTDHVAVIAPAKGMSEPTVYSIAKVQKKYGFGPEKVPFYKALRGDPSDNIPGVPGVGEVTATKLVLPYDDLDALFEALKRDERPAGISPKMAANVLANEKSARLSLQLATIDQEAPVTFAPEECIPHEFERQPVVDLFVRLGFRSLLKDLPGYNPDDTSALFGAKDLEEDEQPAAAAQLDTDLEPVLAAISERGVLIDTSYLKELDTKWRGELAALEKKSWAAAGHEFNLDSSRQLATVLYEELHLPTVGIKSGTTGLTTDARTLTKLKDTHPLIPLMLEYRELAKLLSTYTAPLPTLIGEDGRLHTTYAADTSTGRISSKNPNLQNIPIRSDRGQLVRRAFVAAPGKTLIRADYSQIELRVVAHLSRDPVMIAAFRAGQDIHTATSQAMHVDRRVAKIINFSILYGKGAYGLAEDIGITREEASAYIKNYFATHKGVDRWIEETLRFLGEHGYVETLFKRRRYFPGTKHSRVHRFSRAGREAINLPVQGTAAEILKRAMLAITSDPILKDATILTVHDELVCEVPTAQVKDAAAQLKKLMETTTTLDVPLEVEVGSGQNWGDTKGDA